jgi:hypothetical protein
VSVPGVIGFIFVIAFFVTLLVLGVFRRKAARADFRAIPVFEHITRAIGLSVEDGSRLHFALGRGSIIGLESAVAFVGLKMLERVARIISISDRLPIVTSGDGALTILSQDTLQSTYRDLGEEAQYDPLAGRLTGATPFSFAAGSIPVILDEQVTANVLIGHYGSEVGLLTDAAERNNSITLAGTDNLNGQAVLFVATKEPLVGEDVFAGGAYLQAGELHTASLRTQDIFRWVIVALLILGALLKLVGLDDVFLSLFVGGS